MKTQEERNQNKQRKEEGKKIAADRGDLRKRMYKTKDEETCPRSPF